MNLDIRRAKRSVLGPGLGPEEGGPDLVQDTGEAEADQGADQTQEAEGAPKAHAGDAPTPETEAGALEADPERERKMILGEEDPKHLPKATAQPGGHAA